MVAVKSFHTKGQGSPDQGNGRVACTPITVEGKVDRGDAVTDASGHRLESNSIPMKFEGRSVDVQSAHGGAVGVVRLLEMLEFECDGSPSAGLRRRWGGGVLTPLCYRVPT